MEYIETHSELDGSKRKHKGRVAFGGHRIHDGYSLTDEILLPLSLGALRQGILLRLVQRDGSQTTVQFDLNALKQDSIAYPLIVRR